MTSKPIEAGSALVRPEGSQPEILVAYKPAGRETLEAITGELVPLPAKFERESSSPEITVRESTIERDTLAAIMAEAATAPAPGPQVVPSAESRPALAPLEIFEMATFVVRGGDVARLASESLRRSFVEEHLLGRLPVSSMTGVERVDVTPWTVPGTLVVRVWCRTELGS
jgi:hypothetical protein